MWPPESRQPQRRAVYHRSPRRTALAWGFASLISLAVVVTAPSQALAQRCAEQASWVTRCAASAGLSMEVAYCPPGLVVLTVRPPSALPQRIELSADPSRGFQSVSGRGLTPVGDFPIFDDAPRETRQALEAVARCLDDAPGLVFPSEAAQPRSEAWGDSMPAGETSSPPTNVLIGSPPPPWFFLLGVLAGGVLLLRRRAELPGEGDPPRALLGLLLLSAGTWSLRGLLVGPDFLHQNGQGPLWVRYALCRASNYGPGFRELFGGAIGALGGEATAALFVLQSALGALAPGLGWLLARGVGARGWLPWALALLLACEPTLARMAQSESYTGPIFVLLLAAGALLSWGLRERSLRSVDALLGVLGAGLLITQAARLHPAAWLPAATIPLVVLVGVPPLDGRWRGWIAATASVGAVAAIGAVPVLLSVAGGDLGGAWLPTILQRARWQILWWSLPVALTYGALLSWRCEDAQLAWIRAAVLAMVGAILALNIGFSGVPTAVRLAFLWIGAVPVLAALAAGLSEALPEDSGRPGGSAVLLILLAAALLRWLPEHRDPPTDVLEQRLLLQRMTEIEPGASVLYLGEGERRRLFLPMYGSCRSGEPTPVRLRITERLDFDPATLRPPTYWYRSSLCSSAEGAGLCAEIERRLPMQRIWSEELPARPSIDDLPYQGQRVLVGLSRLIQ